MKRAICSLVVLMFVVSVSFIMPSAAHAGVGSAYTVLSDVPSGNGTLTPGSQSIAEGTDATINIVPAVGYHLVSLVDNGIAVLPLPSGTYQMHNVTSDHTVGAVFGRDSITETLRVVEPAYPDSFFPLLGAGSSGQRVRNYYMASPVGMTPRGELYGDLCSTVPTLENGDLVRNADGTATTIVRFRPSLKWSDGQPLSVDDYIFSYHMGYGVNPQDPIMGLVTSVDKIDDYTCRVSWSQWNPFIPLGWDIYPQHVLGPIFTAGGPSAIQSCNYGQHPIHAGPYVLASMNPGVSVTFLANPFYWQFGKPKIPGVEISVVSDSSAIVSGLTSGVYDVASGSLPIDIARQFQQMSGTLFDVYFNKGATVGTMEWNLTSKWFNDRRVRQAFYYATDRTLITQNALVGDEPVLSPLFPGSPYAQSVLARYTYNPDQANVLLDAAGWTWNEARTQRVLPDGSPAILTIAYSAGATFREREVGLLRAMLAKVGITIQDGPTDSNSLVSSWLQGTFIAALHGTMFSNYDTYGCVQQFGSDQVPTRTASGWVGQNYARYNSADMDYWLGQARTAVNVVESNTAYEHIQNIFADDLPCFYLEQRAFPDAVRKGIIGYDYFSSSTVSYCWNVQDWQWDAGAVLGEQPVAAEQGNTVTVPLTVNVTSAAATDVQVTVASSDPTHVALTDITAGDLNSTSTPLSRAGGTKTISAQHTGLPRQLTVAAQQPRMLLSGGTRALAPSGSYTLDPATGSIHWTAPTGSCVTGFHTIAYLTFKAVGAPGPNRVTVTARGTSGDTLGSGAGGAAKCAPTTVPAYAGWNLTTGVTGHGRVSRLQDQQLYADGTTVTLIATPDLGWHLSGWIGATKHALDPLAATVIMNANRQVTAVFAVNPLIVNIVGSGSVLKTPDETDYAAGTVVTLTALPVVGYHFMGWFGDVTGIANPATITMDGAKTVTASFVADLPTPGPTPTTSVLTLAATCSASAVNLSWHVDSAGTYPITGYQLLRSTTSGGETPLATLPAGTLSYSDATAAVGQLYYYTVRAVDSSNAFSAMSAEVAARLIIGASGTVSGATSVGMSSFDAGRGSDLQVTKSGNGTPVVTIGTYATLPAAVTALFAANPSAALYRDVKINDTSGVDSLAIDLYYTDAEVAATGAPESSFRLFWWNGSAWQACSDQTLHTDAVAFEGSSYSGYVQVTISNATSPSLAQMTGTIFGLVPFVAPSILLSPASQTIAATTTAHIVVTGGSANSTLQVTPQPDGQYAMSGNEFVLTPSTLDVGKTFTLTVTAISVLGASGSASATITVITPPDTIGPRVTVDALAASVSSKTLTARGFVQDAESGVRSVSINGKAIVLCADGSFAESVALVPGLNMVVVEAVDNRGNVTHQEYAVTCTAGVTTPAESSLLVVLAIGQKSMLVNGMPVSIDAAPIIRNGRTLLPIRALIETLGGKVTWDAKTQIATVVLGGRSVVLEVGKSSALVNGKRVLIDPTNAKVVPEIIGNRTFLPLRFIADGLGLDLAWEPVSQTISFTYWP